MCHITTNVAQTINVAQKIQFTLEKHDQKTKPKNVAQKSNVAQK